MTGMDEQSRTLQSLRRGSGDSMHTRKAHATREALSHGPAQDQPDAREGQAGRDGVAEGLVVPGKSGNADGGKEPWFKADAGSSEGDEIGTTLQNSGNLQQLRNAYHVEAKGELEPRVEEPRWPETGGVGGCVNCHDCWSRVAHSAVSPSSLAHATFRGRKHEVLSESRMREICLSGLMRGCAKNGLTE